MEENKKRDYERVSHGDRPRASRDQDFGSGLTRDLCFSWATGSTRGRRTFHLRKLDGRLAPDVSFWFKARGQRLPEFEAKGQQSAFVSRFSRDSYKSHAAIKGIERALCEIIPEPLEPLGDAVVFLQVAEFQYLETGNPLWIWFVVSLCSLANICPPAWAWEYMLSVGNLVTDGAIAVRRPDEKRVKYTEETLMGKLGFPKKSAGKKDRFAEFRQCMTDFRLALRVRKLAFDSKTGERKNVLQACEDIAKQEKIEQKKKRTTNKGYVYKAYSRWFSDDGCLRLTPEVRNPR